MKITEWEAYFNTLHADKLVSLESALDILCRDETIRTQFDSIQLLHAIIKNVLNS
jgi:hypothetical protein